MFKSSQMIWNKFPVSFSGDISIKQNFLYHFNNILVQNIQPDSFVNLIIVNAIIFTGKKIERIGGSIKRPKNTMHQDSIPLLHVRWWTSLPVKKWFPLILMLYLQYICQLFSDKANGRSIKI